MVERWSSRRKKLSVRVGVTAALVGTGLGVMGVVPALADDDDVRTLNVRVDDRGRDRGDDEYFRGRKGDVRYVWFKICTDDGISSSSTVGSSTVTSSSVAASATVDASGSTPTDTATVAADAVSQALTAGTELTVTDDSTTDVTGSDTTDPTSSSLEASTDDSTTAATDTVDDSVEAEYPPFVTIPMKKDDAKLLRAELRELDRDQRDDVCYDLPGSGTGTTTGTEGAVVLPNDTRLTLSLVGEFTRTTPVTPTTTATLAPIAPTTTQSSVVTPTDTTTGTTTTESSAVTTVNP